MGVGWPGTTRASLLVQVRPDLVTEQAAEQEGCEGREEDRVRDQACGEQVQDERQGQAGQPEGEATRRLLALDDERRRL